MTQDEVEDFVRFLFEEGRDLADRMGGEARKAAKDADDAFRKHTS
jgi:hypothetical protein